MFSDSCVNTVDADWDTAVKDGRGSFSTSVGEHGRLWSSADNEEAESEQDGVLVIKTTSGIKQYKYILQVTNYLPQSLDQGSLWP